MNKIQTLFELLSDMKEKTSMDIQEHIITVAVGSMVCDLRKAGCDIKCRYIRTTAKGAKVYGYIMLSYPVSMNREAA